MMNKKEGHFDENDEKLVGMLAAHMSVFIRQLEGGRQHVYEQAQPLQSLSATPKTP